MAEPISNRASRPKRVMAVASAGGHWVQLRRLRPAWADCVVDYVTTEPGYRASVEADPPGPDGRRPGFHAVPDANRWQKVRLARQMAALLLVTLRVRPDVVISTAAAPGYFALRFGKMLGARTVWLDSIANPEELSLAGRRVARHADLYLTQWAHLAEDKPGGPRFEGAVL